MVRLIQYHHFGTTTQTLQENANSDVLVYMTNLHESKCVSYIIDNTKKYKKHINMNKI